MVVSVKVKANTKELRTLLKLFSKRDIPKLISSQINRSMKVGKNRTARALRDETGIKVSVLKKYVRQHKSNPITQAGKVTVHGKRIPIYQATGGKATQTASGVTYKLGKQTHHIKSAFIQTMPKTGRRSIFKRVDKRRLPINEQTLESNPDIFNRENMADDLLPEVTEHYEENLGKMLKRIAKARGFI